MSAQQRKAKKTPKKALATNYALEWRILWNHYSVYAWGTLLHLQQCLQLANVRQEHKVFFHAFQL